MKTKIYLSLIVLGISVFVDMASAAWYGLHTVNIVPGGATNCNEDGLVNLDATVPVNADYTYVLGSPPPYYETATLGRRRQAQVRGPNATNPTTQIDCYYWDATPPTLGANSTSPIWYNSTINITLTSGDLGGSGLNYARYRLDNSDCVGAGSTPYANGAILPINTDGDHTLYLCGMDNAGMTSTVTRGPYRYDGTVPTATSITYPNGWSNTTTIPITVNGGDVGGSGINRYEVEYMYSDASPLFSAGWSGWTPLTSIFTSAGSASYNYNVAGSPGRAYRFRFRTVDGAGNVSTWRDNPALQYQLDTVQPDRTQFNPTAPTANNANLIATLTQVFTFNYAETGSPVSVSGNFERNANPVLTDAIVMPIGVYTLTRDISNVSTDIGANGGRAITFTMMTVTDAAGNMSAGAPRIFTWYVYADKNNATTSPAGFGGPYVADGLARAWNITIRDQFLNPIIPATGINRIVALSLTNIDNDMYLNQYTRNPAAGTSVYVRTSTYAEQPLTTSSSTQNLGNQSSANGTYTIDTKVYTPTANSYSVGAAVSDPDASFAYDPSFTITDTLAGGPRILSNGSPVFSFLPLFTSSITGDLRNGGFIEGIEQNSTITITRDPSALPNAVSSTAVYLEFSGALSSVTNFDFYTDSTTPSTAFPYSVLTQFNISPSFPGAATMNSRLIQKLTTVVLPTSDLSLSSHIAYSLDGKTIITNSDVIARTGGYFGSAVTGQGAQVGVKILGALSSSNTTPIVTNQFISGISMFKNINRGAIREAIRKNVALATRNTTLTSIAGTISNVASLPIAGTAGSGVIINQSPSKSILYIERAGGNIDITASSISGIRTVVVKGANLYIRNDLSYASPGSLLGVVVQKNNAGQGGNLYIDPSITNIVGSYVIDGSIISYNGTELGYNSSINVLKNQLYLFGSITSENTIGGSRQNPPVCPSLVTGTCSTPPTIAEAQKYDLNYLRRYYLYNGEPFGTARVIGGETCNTSTCTNVNTTLLQKFLSPTDDLAKYPFIIEFNPLILRVQPTGFENVIE